MENTSIFDRQCCYLSIGNQRTLSLPLDHHVTQERPMVLCWGQQLNVGLCQPLVDYFHCLPYREAFTRKPWIRHDTKKGRDTLPRQSNGCL